MNGPDYVIAGASKCGTTWVAHCLKEHPEVCIPLKEINFFNHNFEKGLGWYMNQFKCKNKKKIMVEKSPQYMTNKKVPSRIKRVEKNIRVIFIVRDPVKRAYSDYLMKYKRGEVGEDIMEELKSRPKIIENGFYYKHIKNYVKKLGRNKVIVMLFDDLKKSNKKFTKLLVKKLGIKYHSPSMIGKKVNKSKSKPIIKSVDKVKVKLLNMLKGRGAAIDTFLKWMLNGWPASVYNELNRRRERPPKMGKEVKRYLLNLYSKDIKSMSEITKKNLDKKWLSQYEV